MTDYKIPDELKSNPNVTVDDYRISEQFWITEFSEWKCYLFGYVESCGITYRPKNGEEPNWFWRTTQHLILGHKWVKEQDNG